MDELFAVFLIVVPFSHVDKWYFSMKGIIFVKFYCQLGHLLHEYATFLQVNRRLNSQRYKYFTRLCLSLSFSLYIYLYLSTTLCVSLSLTLIFSLYTSFSPTLSFSLSLSLSFSPSISLFHFLSLSLFLSLPPSHSSDQNNFLSLSMMRYDYPEVGGICAQNSLNRCCQILNSWSEFDFGWGFRFYLVYKNGCFNQRLTV